MTKFDEAVRAAQEAYSVYGKTGDLRATPPSVGNVKSMLKAALAVLLPAEQCEMIEWVTQQDSNKANTDENFSHVKQRGRRQNKMASDWALDQARHCVGSRRLVAEALDAARNSALAILLPVEPSEEMLIFIDKLINDGNHMSLNEMYAALRESILGIKPPRSP